MGWKSLSAACFLLMREGSVSEPFFPRTSPWKAAFVVTFLMLVVCLSAAVFFAWREKQEKKKSKKVRDAKQKEVTEKGTS